MSRYFMYGTSLGGVEQLMMLVKITVENDDIYSWNIGILIKEFGVDQKLKAGENIIEFNPTHSDAFMYCCWLDQITRTVTVQDINNYIKYLGCESDSFLCHNGSGI
ncbi:hypothetical protein [Acetobacterium sp. MES1]|uniref:hypothetical protein n=1 Tax=Acetobacterium sp. MES1 TaxID=1899015 RepID=UPI00257A9160|nr:hypothetical protein [Acetobacterium sp. MES1]